MNARGEHGTKGAEADGRGDEIGLDRPEALPRPGRLGAWQQRALRTVRMVSALGAFLWNSRAVRMLMP